MLFGLFGVCHTHECGNASVAAVKWPFSDSDSHCFFLKFSKPCVSYVDDTAFIFDGNSSSEQINLFIRDVAVQ